MTNDWGRAARYALDPYVVLQFLIHVRNGRADSATHARMRHPKGWDDAIQGRIVRRWHTQKGVTLESFNTVFACYAQSEQDYIRWANAHGYAPVLHDRRTA